MRNNSDKKVKLTANILFSGIGCQERGFQDSGVFDVEVLNTSDINKESVLSYAAIHCGLTKEVVETYDSYPTREEMAQYLSDINLGYEPEKNKKFDWFKLIKKKTKDLEKYWLACKLAHNLGDISRIEELPYADFWTCSFPCFTEDTLVLTKEFGYIPINNVKKGMNVLTHNNKYQTVLNSAKTGEKNIYKINAMCFDELECTENHRFLVRTRHRVNTRINGKPITYRYFDKPQWKECKNLTKDDYLGYAINQNSVIPKWEDDVKTNVKLSHLMNNEDFWWIVGRYIADGFKQTGKTGSKIVLCCGKQKVSLGLIEKHLDNCGLHYCTDDHLTCLNYHICSNELYKFISQFGDKAYGKFIPPFVFDMPVELCKAFLDGYWSGDGCFSENLYKASSISRNLIYGLGQLIAKIYHRPFSIYFNKRKSTGVIEGRTVNQRSSYQITFRKENQKQDKAFYEDGYIWFPINSITNMNSIKSVYDITVENDHSFTANGAIVHNCTDISIAGKMKGLNPDSGTRSSLLWENMRLLKRAKDTNTLPKYIMVENVKNLVSKKFIDEFNDLLVIFDELGFNSYYKVLNGKDCGVPQNRERVFVIGIRKDIDNGAFTFPLPFDTGVRLKDILEETVDEKYYLSDDIQKRLKITDETFTKNIIGTTLGNDCTRFGQRDVVYQQDSIMGALTASDYKQPKQILDTAVLHQVAQLYGTEKEPNPQAGRIYNAEGISPTLDTCSGGNRMPKIIQVGQVSNEGSQAGKVYNPEGVSQTICACTHGYAIGNIIDKLRVRKLTPRECFTLMGFSFDDCDKARNIGISDTHLYKQAGNGIITNCCSLLAEHLYKAQYDKEFVCTDEKMQNFQSPQTD